MLINLPQAQKLEHKADRDSCDTWQHSQSPPPPPTKKASAGFVTPVTPETVVCVWGGGFSEFKFFLCSVEKPCGRKGRPEGLLALTSPDQRQPENHLG